jgi:hypothetical protein
LRWRLPRFLGNTGFPDSGLLYDKDLHLKIIIIRTVNMWITLFHAGWRPVPHSQAPELVSREKRTTMVIPWNMGTRRRVIGSNP